MADQKPSTSNEAGPSKGKVSMVCADGQTALHSPVWINGVKFTPCLMDSGSEINLISGKDPVKHGFMYELGGIKKIFRIQWQQQPN